MIRGLVVLFVVLSACASNPPPSPEHASEPTAPAPEHARAHAGLRRDPTPQERQAIRQLLTRTERIRELRFRADVRVDVEDQASIVQGLTEEFEEEDLVEGQAMYTALGLLPEGIDLLAMLTSVMGEQVVGFYDPKRARLVVRNDVMENLGRGSSETFDEARVVLVHEMVHTLQDQRLGLGRRFEEERDTDPENAFRSVVEGDATLAMIGYVVEERGGTLASIAGNSAFLGAITSAASPVGSDQLSRAPAIVRIGLVAPYIQGLEFTADLYTAGGWAQVDRAHASLPVSMEQVMHPALFHSGEAPESIALPAFPGLDQAGYRPIDDDTLGELELGIFLGQTEADSVAEEAAQGWGGDRLRLYRHATERPAIVWWTTWDTERDATEAETAARATLTLVPASDRGSHLVKRTGRAVLILRWLPPALQTAVVDAFTRFATALPAHH